MENQNVAIKFKNQDEIFDFIEKQNFITKDTINEMIDRCPDDANNDFLELEALRKALNTKDKTFDLYDFFDPYNTRCGDESQITSFYGRLTDSEMIKLLKLIKPGTVPDWLIQSLFKIGFYADKKNNRYSFFNIYEDLTGACFLHYVDRKYIEIVFKICGEEYLKNHIVDIYKQTNYLRLIYFQKQILDKIDDYTADDFFTIVRYYFSNRGVEPPSKTLILSYDSYLINQMQLFPAFGFLVYENQNYKDKTRDLFFNILKKYSECAMDNKKECLVNLLEMFIDAYLHKYSFVMPEKNRYCLPRIADEDVIEIGLITNKTFAKVTHLIGTDEIKKLLDIYISEQKNLLKDIFCHKYFYLLFEPDCIDSQIFNRLLENDVIDKQFMRNIFRMHNSSVRDNSLDINIFKKLTQNPELYFLRENTKFVVHEYHVQKFNLNKIDDFDFLFDILLDDKFDCDNVVHVVLQKYFDWLKIDSTSKITFNKLFQVCLNYLSFYDEFDYVFENVFLYYEDDLLENDFIILLNNLTYKKPVISAQKTSKEKFFNVRKISIKHFEQYIAHKNFRITKKEQINSIIKFYIGDDEFQKCRQNFQLEKSVCYGKQKIDNEIFYLLLDKIFQAGVEVDIQLLENLHDISNLSRQEITNYTKTKFGDRTEKLILDLKRNIQADKENNQNKIMEEAALEKEAVNKINMDYINQKTNKLDNGGVAINVSLNDNLVLINQNKNENDKESKANKQHSKILGNKDKIEKEDANKNEKVDIQEKKNKQEQKKDIEVRENNDDNDSGKDIDNKIKENSNQKIEPEGNSKIDEKEIKEENTEKNEKVDIQEKKNKQGQKKEIEVRENNDDNDKRKDIDNKIKENSNQKIETEGNSEIDEKGIKEETSEKKQEELTTRTKNNETQMKSKIAEKNETAGGITQGKQDKNDKKTKWPQILSKTGKVTFGLGIGSFIVLLILFLLLGISSGLVLSPLAFAVLGGSSWKIGEYFDKEISQNRDIEIIPLQDKNPGLIDQIRQNQGKEQQKIIWSESQNQDKKNKFQL